MKFAILSLTASAVLFGVPAAAAKKDCAELKTEIDSTLQKKNLKDYQLDVVEADKAGDAKVIGSCDGGAKKVVYHKGQGKH